MDTYPFAKDQVRAAYKAQLRDEGTGKKEKRDTETVYVSSHANQRPILRISIRE